MRLAVKIDQLQENFYRKGYGSAQMAVAAYLIIYSLRDYGEV